MKKILFIFFMVSIFSIPFFSYAADPDNPGIDDTYTIPPDMSEVCTTFVQDASTTVVTCEKLWHYYKSDIADLLIFLGSFFAVKKFVDYN